MTEHATATATRSLVVEREMPHAPEKVWRALTQGALIADWLMSNDFQPVVGHRFNFRAPPMPNWNGVTDCEVLAVEPQERLSYSWNASGDEAANGVKTIVTFTLTPVRASFVYSKPVLFLGWRDNPHGRWRGRCLPIGRRRLTKWLAASRKPKGPGEFGPIPSGFGFVRWVNIGLAKSLDLEPNSLRQNGSE